MKSTKISLAFVAFAMTAAIYAFASGSGSAERYGRSGVRGGGETKAIIDSGDCNQRNGYSPCAQEDDICHFCDDNQKRKVLDPKVEEKKGFKLTETKDCGYIWENGKCKKQTDGTFKCIGAKQKWLVPDLVKAVCDYVDEKVPQ